jgi:hypothetical protein
MIYNEDIRGVEIEVAFWLTRGSSDVEEDPLESQHRAPRKRSAHVTRPWVRQ